MKTTNFADKVRKVVRNIPVGLTLTYGEVARRAGNPLAARAVGSLMRKNFDTKIPCHRVIRSDGSLGGYNRGGTKVKSQLLSIESRKVKLRRNRGRDSIEE